MLDRDQPDNTQGYEARRWLLAGAIAGASAVFLGAATAHLSAGAEDVRSFTDIGLRYQFWHALALLGVAGLGGQIPGRRPARFLNAAGWLFACGIILFCGSLYALAFTGTRQWGFVTPFGGVALALGWTALAAAALSRRR